MCVNLSAEPVRSQSDRVPERGGERTLESGG
jgi:hypothetical protein